MAKATWDKTDLDDVARLRDRRLRRQVRFQLYPYSPFYRTAFDSSDLTADGFGGISDLRRLPLIDRAVLASHADEFVLKPNRASMQRWASARQVGEVILSKLLRGIEASDKLLKHEYEPVHVLETTGSYGDPIPIRLSRRDLAVLGTQGGRLLEVAGVTSDDIMLNLLEASSAGGFWPAWSGGVAMGVQQVAPGFLEPPQAAALANKMGATVLFVVADDALPILDAAGEDGIPTLKTLILGPQPVGAVLRRRLSEAVGPAVKIIGTYGFAEARALWAECAEGAGKPDVGYHVSPDLQLFEVISTRTLAPVRQTEPGEIVFTGLDQRGTALVRYRPGDVTMNGIVLGRCPYCGRVVDRILGPVRRAHNLLELQFAGSDPIAVDVEVLADALAHPWLAAWQVEIGKTDGDPRGPDEVYVLYEPLAGRDPGHLAVELDKVFRDDVGFSPTQFVLTTRASGGVVDLRPVPVASDVVRSSNGDGEAPLVRLWRTPGQ